MSQEEQGIVSALSKLFQEIGVTCLVQVGAEDGGVLPFVMDTPTIVPDHRPMLRGLENEKIADLP